MSLSFGKFFSNVDSAYVPLYKRYFGPTLPSSNVLTATSAAYTSLFQLQKISATSAFGGSIELTFSESESYGPELIDDAQQTMWDVPAESRLRLFVPITADGFNYPVRLAPVFVKLDPGPSIKYTKSGSTWVIEAEAADATDAAQALAAKLSDAPGSNPVSQYSNIARFVYGFINAQLLETYDFAHEKMTSLLIADNSIDVSTESKKQYAFIELRLEAVVSATDAAGRDELSVRADNYVSTATDEWISTTLNVRLGHKLGNGENTRWVRVAQLSPEEIDLYKPYGGLWTDLTLREHDPVFDDLFHSRIRYGFGSATGASVISALQSNASDQQIDEYVGAVFTDPVSPSFAFHYRMIAGLR